MFNRILESTFRAIVQSDSDFSNVSCFDKLENIELLQTWNLRTIQLFLQEHDNQRERDLQEQEQEQEHGQREKKQVHFLAATTTPTTTPTNAVAPAPAILKKEEVRHLQTEFEELQKVYESKKYATPPSTSPSPPPPASPRGLLEDRPLENMEEVLQRHIEERNRLLQ